MSSSKFFTISTDEVDQRLDRFLRRQLDLPQSVIEKSLRLKKILVNDGRSTSSYRLQEHDCVTVNTNFDEKPERQTDQKGAYLFSKEDEALLEKQLIWEDEQLIVVNKPAGLAVQGGSKIKRHLDGMLTAYAKKNNFTVRLVHRLDRDTSGVLIAAKTLKMANHLAAMFKEKSNQLRKVYWAILQGRPEQEVIEFPLLKQKINGQEKVVVDEKNGKKSRTELRIIKKISPMLYLVELNPITGRTHQLRVHCAAINCPILGDLKYGFQGDKPSNNNLFLHARILSIRDLDANKFDFVAPVPEHFEEILTKYRIKLGQF